MRFVHAPIVRQVLAPGQIAMKREILKIDKSQRVLRVFNLAPVAVVVRRKHGRCLTAPMTTFSSATSLVALLCVVLASMKKADAVCRASDVNIWYAGGAADTTKHIKTFEAAGYRLVYTSNYLTNSDLRVNVIMIRDSSIKTSYRMNALTDSTPPSLPGFCANAVSTHTNRNDYITYMDEECDNSVVDQKLWYDMGEDSFRKKAQELYDKGYNMRAFAVYGCR
jgi:hypothetical protein